MQQSVLARSLATASAHFYKSQACNCRIALHLCICALCRNCACAQTHTHTHIHTHTHTHTHPHTHTHTHIHTHTSTHTHTHKHTTHIVPRYTLCAAAHPAVLLFSPFLCMLVPLTSQRGTLVCYAPPRKLGASFAAAEQNISNLSAQLDADHKKLAAAEKQSTTLTVGAGSANDGS